MVAIGPISSAPPRAAGPSLVHGPGEADRESWPLAVEASPRPADRFAMRPTAAVVASLLGQLALMAPGVASAQSLGTFRWQLAPFCNAVTVTVTQGSGVYTLDGFDDQCGAPQRAPVVGVATPNPDGTIGLGFQIVTVPGGRLVGVDARISLSGLGGPWTDSAGNSGTMVFDGPGTGAARPLPSVGPTWGTDHHQPGVADQPGRARRRHQRADAVGGRGGGRAVGRGGRSSMPSSPAAVVGASRDQFGVLGLQHHVQRGGRHLVDRTWASPARVPAAPAYSACRAAVRV